MNYQRKSPRKDTTQIMSKRVSVLLKVMGIFMLFLLGKIFYMQVFKYDEYQQKVIDQITVSSTLTAERGDIYDANMNLLATNKTVWRLFISPKDIKDYSDDKKIDYADLISKGLSDITGVAYDDIYAKTQKTNRLDETIVKAIDEDTYDKVIEFVVENGLSRMVYTQASTTRYYPYGTLASHVIGFTGSDTQGLFGLEMYYDDDLTGTNGKYITAVDAHSNEIPYDYSSYIPAVDGLSLVTTIDSYIQRELENELAEIVEEFDVKNRATGIVMDVNTGAILGMATSSPFDSNNPYMLDEISQALLDNSGYEVGSEEYKTYNTALLYDMWRNKAVSELYEPGSTFKIITAAMGFELGKTTAQDHGFSCPGYHIVGGVKIKCWRSPNSHGSGITFSYGLQQSCNPTLMQLAERIGTENFYKYFGMFGYLEKTNVDLPSESATIFHNKNALGSVELAVASFGQRFKVTALQQLTAICAVANGGYLVTPHLVDSLIDEDKNVVYKYDTTVKRQVISKQSAEAVSAILEEGVSGTGASKNAYVAGYRIAAKTGTSEKLDKPDKNGNFTLRIGSCVAYAPYTNASIAAIIIVDEPTLSYYGATVAAPYISDLLSKVMPYLGYEPNYTDKQLASMSVNIGNYVGKTVGDAKRLISNLGLSCDFGNASDSDVITAQTPRSGTALTKGMGTVILYTEYNSTSSAVVPDLLGKSVTEANQILISRGLNIKIEGSQNYAISETEYARATYQSIAAGTSVDRGTVVSVRFLYDDRD